MYKFIFSFQKNFYLLLPKGRYHEKKNLKIIALNLKMAVNNVKQRTNIDLQIL